MTLNPSETKMATHDSTNPPPLPGNPSSPDSTGQWEWVRDKFRTARRESSEADDKATEALSIAKRIESTIGTPSNQALQLPGTGLTGAVERVLVEIQADRAAAQADRTAAQANRAEQAKRNDWALWAVKIVVGALLVAATGGCIAWIVGLHH